MTRGVQDTSKDLSMRLFEEAYYTHSKRLRATLGLELVTWGRHPVYHSCRRYRANIRTVGSLCPLQSEGR